MLSDIVLSWIFVGVLVEASLILFAFYRLINGSRLLAILLALMAFFTLMMAVMSIAVLLGEGRTIAFTAEIGNRLAIAFVVMGAIAIALLRMKSWPYAKTAAGERALQRDLDGPKRKRPLILDLLGCAVLGAVSVVLLVVLIAAAIALLG